MPRRDRYLMLGLAWLSTVVLLAGVAGLVEPLLLYAAPLLVMLLPLLAGRYVGEDRLARLAGTVRRRRRRPVVAVGLPASARRVVSFVPRGGRLIASSLAVRPPPASVVAR